MTLSMYKIISHAESDCVNGIEIWNLVSIALSPLLLRVGERDGDKQRMFACSIYNYRRGHSVLRLPLCALGFRIQHLAGSELRVPSSPVHGLEGCMMPPPSNWIHQYIHEICTFLEAEQQRGRKCTRFPLNCIGDCQRQSVISTGYRFWASNSPSLQSVWCTLPSYYRCL